MKRTILPPILVMALLSGCRAAVPEPTDIEPAPLPVGVVMLADIAGTLEPCGCVPELQRGGLHRLPPVLARHRETLVGAPVVHAGPLFFSPDALTEDGRRQWEAQSRRAADMLRASSIDVAVASSLDMVAGDFDVLARRAGTRLISANAREGAYAFEASALRIAGDVRILFVGLTAPLPVPSSTWSVSDPVAALREVLEKPHGADVVVLLSDLGPGETRRVVRAVPGVDFALVGGHAEDAELTDHVETTESGVRILQLHREGRFVGRLELVPGEGPGFVHVGPPGRAEAEWLGHRARDLQDAVERYLNAPDAAARRAEVEAARRALADDATHLLGRRACPTGRACFEFTAHAIEWSFPQHAGNAALLRKWLDVDLPGLNCRPGPITEGPAFAGATACAGCHDDTVKDWAGTPHAHAWSTLEQRRATCDVGCIDCHTTGFRRPGGFDFTEQGEPAGLTNVQCEACHGPAAAHAEDDAVPMSLAADRATCVTCHNRKHSPSFHFETYRARLLTPAHGGKP